MILCVAKRETANVATKFTTWTLNGGCTGLDGFGDYENQFIMVIPLGTMIYHYELLYTIMYLYVPLCAIMYHIRYNYRFCTLGYWPLQYSVYIPILIKQLKWFFTFLFKLIINPNLYKPYANPLKQIFYRIIPFMIGIKYFFFCFFVFVQKSFIHRNLRRVSLFKIRVGKLRLAN